MNQLRSQRLAFLGIVLLSGIANLALPSALNSFAIPLFLWRYRDIVVGILNGLFFGEFISVAFWILLDPISLHRRLLLGFCAGFFLATCRIIGTQDWEGILREVAIMQWLVGVLFPIAFAVSLRCWSPLVVGKDFPLQLVRRRPRQAQFGTGFLLSSMSALAIAFAIIRVLLPPGVSWRSGSSFELLAVGGWLVLFVIATSMFTVLAFATVVLPTRVRIGSVILLTILGPSFFQWVASGIVRFDFKAFEPLAQSMAIGFLISGVILGIVFRLFGHSSLPSSPNTDSFPSEPPSPLSP